MRVMVVVVTAVSPAPVMVNVRGPVVPVTLNVKVTAPCALVEMVEVPTSVPPQR